MDEGQSLYQETIRHNVSGVQISLDEWKLHLELRGKIPSFFLSSDSRINRIHDCLYVG